MRQKFAQWLLLIRYCLHQAGAAVVLVVFWLTAPIGFREVLLFSGAGLIGYGLFMVFPPAAFIVPGMIIAYVALFGVP